VAVPTGLKQIPVAVTVSGTYYNIVQFLTKVEGLQRSMLVYGVDIQPDDVTAASGSSPAPSSSSTHLKVSIQTRIFYSPPVVTPPVTTPATGAAPASSGSAAPATAS
jgi:Tfp pilus assembly protein PilO